MTIKTKDGRFVCIYCEKPYKTEKEAVECREKHDLIYVPLSRPELNKLLHYIMAPNNPKVLDDTYIVKVLMKFSARGNRDHSLLS